MSQHGLIRDFKENVLVLARHGQLYGTVGKKAMRYENYDRYRFIAFAALTHACGKCWLSLCLGITPFFFSRTSWDQTSDTYDVVIVGGTSG